MDAREMQYKVEQRLLSFKLEQTKFESDDIFDWLNEAQIAFVKSRFVPIEYNTPDAFERIQREVDDLRLLVVKSSEIIGNDNPDLKNKEYDLPGNYFYMVDPMVYLTVGGCTPSLKSVRVVPNFRINDMLSDRLFTTTKKSPLSVLIGNKIRIYYNDFSLGNAILTYIKKPNVIGINPETLELSNCELATHTHNDIVELAVQYAYRILNVNQTK